MGSWQDRGDNRFWIDHLTLTGEDAAVLSSARELTLWNVRLPPAFFARLNRLEILDLRGGSGKSLEAIGDARSLRVLVVNQIRGLANVDAISGLHRLEFLSLYGLRHIRHLPPLGSLPLLKRVELGQMRDLQDVSALLGATALEELLFVKRLGINADAIAPLRHHPSLKMFDWVWEDVPASQARPVLEALPLPKVRPISPAEWLREVDGRRA